MFGESIEALDSHAGMDLGIGQDYDTLQPRSPGVYTASAGNFESIENSLTPAPSLERTFLMNPHDQVNPSLAPKATKHSMMTPAQKEKAKATRKNATEEKKTSSSARLRRL